MSLSITVLPLRVLSERLSEPRGRAALVLTCPQEPAENLRLLGTVSFRCVDVGSWEEFKGHETGADKSPGAASVEAGFTRHSAAARTWSGGPTEKPPRTLLGLFLRDGAAFVRRC